MRSILLIVLSGLYLLLIFKQYLPYIEFFIFEERIVKEKCVQRDAPVNKCMGKCHLNKQIKKVTQGEDPVEKTKIVVPQEDTHLLPHIVHRLRTIVPNRLVALYTCYYPTIYPDKPIIPPQFAHS